MQDSGNKLWDSEKVTQDTMRILIANPAYKVPLDEDHERYCFGAGCHAQWSLIKRKKDLPRFSMFPFILGYTAALMEREGFDVKVVAGVPLNLSDEEFIDRCCAVAPNIVLFEPATIDFKKICEVSNILFKRIPVRIVFAGPHVTFFRRIFWLKRNMLNLRL